MKTTLLLLLAATGCGTLDGTETGSDDTNDTNDTVDTSDTGDTGTLETTYATTWGADSVTLTITNGSGTYHWGLAETDPNSPDPWTGEDCLNGYTAGDGTVFSYCHPATSTGASLTYGGKYNQLNEDTETVFSASFNDTKVTHAVWTADGGTCVTWGGDTSYYTGAGCTAI